MKKLFDSIFHAETLNLMGAEAQREKLATARRRNVIFPRSAVASWRANSLCVFA